MHAFNANARFAINRIAGATRAFPGSKLATSATSAHHSPSRTLFTRSNGSSETPKPSLSFVFIASAIAAFTALEVRKVYAEQPRPIDADENPGMRTEVSYTGAQNDQVKLARESPGVWLWGSNR